MTQVKRKHSINTIWPASSKPGQRMVPASIALYVCDHVFNIEVPCPNM